MLRHTLCRTGYLRRGRQGQCTRWMKVEKIDLGVVLDRSRRGSLCGIFVSNSRAQHQSDGLLLFYKITTNIIDM